MNTSVKHSENAMHALVPFDKYISYTLTIISSFTLTKINRKTIVYNSKDHFLKSLVRIHVPGYLIQ